MKNEITDLSRRQFALSAAATFLGVSALDTKYSEAASQQYKNIIYIFLDGGISHLDSFDCGKAADVQGDTKAISTNVDGIRISQWFPLMSKIADRAVFINSMTSRQGQHDLAKILCRTSYNKVATIKMPGNGAWLQKLQGVNNPNIPASVLLNPPSTHVGAGFLESKYAPLALDPNAGIQNIKQSVPDNEFLKRMSLLNNFNSSFASKYNSKDISVYTDLYNESIRMMRSVDVKSFDLSNEDQKTKNRYGGEKNKFAMACLLAKRLVSNPDGGCRHVEINFSGWDHHSSLWDIMPGMSSTLDLGVTALVNDLSSNGMLKNTLIALVTDFGRTPQITTDRTSPGRNHHPRAYSSVLIGAGIRGGMIFGKTDDKGFAVTENPVSPEDLNATILSIVGVDISKQVFSSSGRPFRPANNGKIIKDIIA